MALIGEKGDCDLKCEGCEKEHDPQWCLKMTLRDIRKLIVKAEDIKDRLV